MYPDLQRAGIDTEAEANAHWQQFGKNEGRQSGMVTNMIPVSSAAPYQQGTFTTAGGTRLTPDQGMMIGGTKYSDQQIRDFYASGGDDNQFAQQAGITDPWQRRELILQARQIAGAGTMAGDAGLQKYFQQYRQYNPNGANVNNFQNWVASQNLHTLDAMRSGTFTGSASSPTDWAPGGIYGPGSGHDFNFEQGRYNLGAHGTSDGWKPWTGAFGETGGPQTSKPMYVDSNGALRYGSPATPPGMMASLSPADKVRVMQSSSSGGSIKSGSDQGMTIGGTTYSGDQIKAWLAGKSPEQIKVQTQAMGLNPTQVQQALTIGGVNFTPQQVQGMTIGGTTYSGDQIKAWLAGKSPEQVKVQAQAMGLTPEQVHQALAIGGVSNYTLSQVKGIIGDSGGASSTASSAAAPKTYAEYESLIKPDMLDAQGRFKGPQFGVNYKAEGMTPQQFYDFMNEQFADPMQRDGYEGTPVSRGIADPRWIEGAQKTGASKEFWTALPMALSMGMYGAAAGAAGAGAEGAGAVGLSSADKAFLLSDLGYSGATASELALMGGGAGAGALGAGGQIAGMTAADAAALSAVPGTALGGGGALGAGGLIAGMTAADAAALSAVPGTALGGGGALGAGTAGAGLMGGGGTAGIGGAGTAGAPGAAGAAGAGNWWQQLASPLLGTVGSVLNQNAAKDAASQQADAQIRAAQIAADAAKFRPVGIKTNFGQSQFGYDENGNLNSAGYTLDPLLQGHLGQLAGASGGLMNQFTSSQMDTAPMRQAAMSAMTLGNKYLQTSPQEQAAKYMADQQGLLAPGRANELAGLQAQMQAQGRGGFAMGGGVNGQGAANPQMQALYNALMQQDAQLAAQSTQGGMDYAKFGTGMVGTGGDMLNSMYGTQSAAFNPYLTALGGAQKIEGLGQNALQMGMDLGGKVTNANAASGLLQAQGIQNAGNTIGANAQQAGNMWGNLLQGGADALSRYKWGT
jgi:hypothetical protein